MVAGNRSGIPMPQVKFVEAWSEYLMDSAQRSVLFWDALRKRGNIFLENVAKGEPPVLIFGYDVLIDGRALDDPCNYALMQIRPPEGLSIDPTKRPVVVVDPRAGQGPGVGGFKFDSEIGFAFRAGHPVYFIGFYLEPVPGQTEAEFLSVLARQARLVQLDPEAALKALPKLLPTEADRERAVAIVARITMLEPALSDPDSPLAKKVKEHLDLGPNWHLIPSLAVRGGTS